MRSIILSTLILLGATAYSQDSVGFKFSLDHIALSVKDVDRSADFYMKVLKLQE